ncbi:hypothetical protein PPACK8108_LOCUS5342 [Phakopsora pachyrhizi]|uniref:Uncharacterized protein n=1 Tax=Phakopsora pachyrhizi TaxID=170000 RepID=A0AAV0ANT7_PHAPC|nr:hypothetical protein PPACK8108_LOCUS5342 [Phakopsora pachyrhizi]
MEILALGGWWLEECYSKLGGDDAVVAVCSSDGTLVMASDRDRMHWVKQNGKEFKLRCTRMVLRGEKIKGVSMPAGVVVAMVTALGSIIDNNEDKE